MISLIRAELIKILGKKSTKVSFIIAVVLMVLSCVFQAASEVNSQNWREDVRQQIDYALKEIEENKGTEQEDFYEELYRPDVAIGEYSLEHNIANNVVTPMKFTYNNTFAMGVWVVLLVILAAINYADEYQFGTIKQILTRPYKRSTILFVKQVVFIGISAVILFVQMAVSYLVGMAFFSENGTTAITLDYVNNKVMEIDMSTSLWQTYVAYVILAIILIAISYLLITIFRTSTLPIVLTLAVWLCSGVITMALSKYEIIRYTIFPHLKLTQYIKGNDLVLQGNTIGLSALVLGVTFLIVELVEYSLFKKRDI